MKGFTPRNEVFTYQKAPKTVEGLVDFMKGRVYFPAPLFGLQQFFSRHPRYINDVIPFLWEQAKYDIPRISPLHEVGFVEVKQLDVVRILAHSFFCSFERDSHKWKRYPSINMDRMFVDPSDVFYTKLRMFFEYFHRQKNRLDAGDSLERNIVFRLQSVSKTWQEWENCTLPLTPFVVHPLGASIDDAKEDFRVDFANQYLGGAALSHGCVQEEIMFVLYPELNVGRLFCAVMEESQAIVMQGAEQFSLPKGYGWSFSYGGAYTDNTPVFDGLMQSHIVAMDAVDYRYADAKAQYTQTHMLRDLNKCYAGFCAQETPQTIATGNWGCGVFGGNAECKALLQWVSASKAEKSVSYYPFDHRVIAARYGALMQQANNKGLRVRDLMSFLSSVDPHTPIVDQYESWLEEQ